MFSRWIFKNSGRGVVDNYSRFSQAGGISEVRRIATMAEAMDVALLPTLGPLGPISLAPQLHIDFVQLNAFIQEKA